MAKGIEFCVKYYPDKFPKEDLTTAFFVSKVAEWYEVMTHKGMVLALSKKNMEKYEKTVKDLHWFSSFYASMKLHKNHHLRLYSCQSEDFPTQTRL